MKRSFRSAGIGVAMTLVLTMCTALSTGCGAVDADGFLALDTCDILNCDGLFFRNLDDDHDDMAGMDGMDDADPHDDEGDDHMDGVDDHDDDGDDDDQMDDMDEHDDDDDDAEEEEHDVSRSYAGVASGSASFRAFKYSISKGCPVLARPRSS